jgi:hypothetical protein
MYRADLSSRSLLAIAIHCTVPVHIKRNGYPARLQYLPIFTKSMGTVWVPYAYLAETTVPVPVN